MDNDFLSNLILDPDAAKMQQMISNNGFSLLYHFTNIENLPRIALLGLLSKKELEERELLEDIVSGGNELSRTLDISYGNWDKVSLSWLPKMPMSYHKEISNHLCYLIFNSSLALAKNVIFTDRNAADSGCNRGSGLDGLNLIKFTSVRKEFPFSNIRIKKEKQAEILLPFSIPPNQIKGVVFRSDSSLRYGRKICERDSPDFVKKFVVDNSIFHLPSPLVNKHIITNIGHEGINRHSLESWRFGEKMEFLPNEDASMILEIKNALPGTRITSIIGQSEFFGREIVNARNTVWTYTELPTDSPGKFVVEVLVDDGENFITQFFETITVG